MLEQALSLSRADEQALAPLESVRATARLQADSRRVASGDVFIALDADAASAQAHALDAATRGARCVIAGPSVVAVLQKQLPQCIGVEGLRRKAGAIAAWWYGTTLTSAAVIAVTGTNGKTTCTQWIAQSMARLEGRAAVVGTLGAGLVEGTRMDAGLAPALEAFGLTTPDVVSWHRMLAQFCEQGVRVVAVEASSIGLHQGRLDGSWVDTAVFTNLTQDHLDYHGSFDAYADAKALLFARPELRQVVINADDPAAARMLAGVQSARRIAYSLDATGRQQAGFDHWVAVSEVYPTAQGFEGWIHFDEVRLAFHVPVLGRYNLANALAVAAVLWGQGVEPLRVVQTLAQLAPVSGRLQTLGGVGEPLVVVDYAHTPDALAKVLETLAEITQVRRGRLWCVFGAGGDRDPGKRPLMGREAKRLADEVIVTSDNPRSESPQAIAQQILEGIASAARHTVRIELDRARAIQMAVGQAADADVVLLAGKGHETTQTIGLTILPFSDVEHAGDALARRRKLAHV